MDPLDIILLDAWTRMSKKVRENRVLALKRSRRRFKGILTRPMREWCLVIRASDTRITAGNALIDPMPRTLADARDPQCNAIGRHEPHTLRLSGTLIRELTKPVSIDWPGVTYEEAARICGREWKTMRTWGRQGMFTIDYYREFGFPRLREEGGKRGGRPYVWTPSPIDPNSCCARPPHMVWGTLWQWLWKNLPEEYELIVDREPHFCVFRGETVFRGWEFVCPGRVNAQGEYMGCGRRCRYLYVPRTVWTLAKAIGDGRGAGFEMPEDSGLAGQWFPGLGDPVKDWAGGVRSFACKKCWRVRGACMARSDGWNEFVSQISGGLLYGRDVPRPLDICPRVRKKREYKWKRAKVAAAARRDDIAAALER